MNSKKGITLIGLVITIIVLLILAGVTIATLSGENGILTKAANAKENNIESQELEMVKLAVQAALTNEERIIKKEELAKELNVEVEELEGTDVWTYISKNKNYYYITPLGEITKSKGIAYSKIKVGTNVTGYKGFTRDENTAIDNWKVYYVDTINNNIYLISSEVTESDSITATPKITNLAGDGLTSYTGTAQLQNIAYGKRFKAVLNGLLKAVTNSENMPTTNVATGGVKKMEYMLDSYNWTSYVSEDADWAIGAPTAELLDMSLEQEANQTGIESARLTSQSLVWQKQTAEGYILNTTGNLSSSSVSRSTTEYFLAAPLANGNGIYGLYLWTYGTNIGYQKGNSKGIRPIVCMKSGISVYDDGNGGYTFKSE